MSMNHCIEDNAGIIHPTIETPRLSDSEDRNTLFKSRMVYLLDTGVNPEEVQKITNLNIHTIRKYAKRGGTMGIEYEISETIKKNVQSLADYYSNRRINKTVVAEQIPSEYTALRPTTFDSFIGQSSARERVLYAIKSARITGQLQHLVFVSEAGSGKTAMVSCIANELNITAIQTIGSVLISGDKVAEMYHACNNGILFIDEAQNIPPQTIPILLKLLEDWILYTSQGSQLVKPFSCIMATNKVGEIDEALRSRLGIPIEFEPYSFEDMTDIIMLRATELAMKISRPIAAIIAERSRNNPRYCGFLVKECYNIAVIKQSKTITSEICAETFRILGIKEHGLTRKDLQLLNRLAINPMSASGCQSYLQMDAKSFSALVESFLLREGYIAISSRGRSITELGKQILHILNAESE